jgi:hypothetical protein
MISDLFVSAYSSLGYLCRGCVPLCSSEPFRKSRNPLPSDPNEPMKKPAEFQTEVVTFLVGKKEGDGNRRTCSLRFYLDGSSP